MSRLSNVLSYLHIDVRKTILTSSYERLLSVSFIDQAFQTYWKSCHVIAIIVMSLISSILWTLCGCSITGTNNLKIHSAWYFAISTPSLPTVKLWYCICNLHTHPHTTYLICLIWYLFTQKALDVAQRNTRPSNLGTSIRDDIEEEREMLQRERDQLHKQIEHMQVCLLTSAFTGFSSFDWVDDLTHT